MLSIPVSFSSGVHPSFGPRARNRTFAALATLDDVMARLDLYSEYVPKQASWHAQSIALEYLGGESTNGALADFAEIATAFDRIASSLCNEG